MLPESYWIKGTDINVRYDLRQLKKKGDITPTPHNLEITEKRAHPGVGGVSGAPSASSGPPSSLRTGLALYRPAQSASISQPDRDKQ